MGKRHPNFPAWQWRNHPQNRQRPTNPALHLIAVPLFIVGFLLIVSGVFSVNLAGFAVGVVGIVASLALRRHVQGLETGATESSSQDAAQRLMV